jgi:hypothetical protein
VLAFINASSIVNEDMYGGVDDSCLNAYGSISAMLEPIVRADVIGQFKKQYDGILVILEPSVNVAIAELANAYCPIVAVLDKLDKSNAVRLGHPSKQCSGIDVTFEPNANDVTPHLANAYVPIDVIFPLVDKSIVANCPCP